MNFSVKITRNFEKEAKPLIKKYPSFKADISQLISELEQKPTLEFHWDITYLKYELQ